MKRLFLTVGLALAVGVSTAAQTEAAKAKKQKENKADTAYVFTDVQLVPVSPIDNQSSSSTCWSFAGTGLLESEMLRQGKDTVNLSEMWIVRHTYLDKAIKYARTHGASSFSPGGNTHDVMTILRTHGAVPQEAYEGLRYSRDSIHRHGELDAVLSKYMQAVITAPNRTLSPVWQDGLNGILDAYLGSCPEKFTYKGKEYTPESFARAMGLNADDFVSFTSYTHHPFYTRFAVEIPDNWAWETSANVPVDELIAIIDTALANGYAVNWSADVSEKGFRYNEGFAIIPVDKPEQMTGSDMARWTGLTAEQLSRMSSKITGPMPEKTITQEMRQEAFDNYETTDDHGRVIVGTARDQWGNKFYKVKNSWGERGKYKGFFYVSEPYVRYKTMNIMVHRNAVPKAIADKFSNL